MPAGSRLMPRALKVYRMPVGFHDAYVAAASQKDAIAAWGSDKDVFTRGQAELVTDPELTADPLASPGTVIKRLRATAAEQIEALGEAEPAPVRTRPSAPKRPAPKPKPRPSRARLDQAEEAVDAAAARHKVALKELDQREAALRRERKALEAEQAQELDHLQAARDKQRNAFDEALRKWRG